METKVKKISVGDTLIMKKPHPCGSFGMKVLRIGSDLRIKCTVCGRDMSVPRVKLEKNIKSVIAAEQEAKTDAER